MSLSERLRRLSDYEPELALLLREAATRLDALEAETVRLRGLCERAAIRVLPSVSGERREPSEEVKRAIQTLEGLATRYDDLSAVIASDLRVAAAHLETVDFGKERGT